jgi:hypothetical protein
VYSATELGRVFFFAIIGALGPAARAAALAIFLGPGITDPRLLSASNIGAENVFLATVVRIVST